MHELGRLKSGLAGEVQRALVMEELREKMQRAMHGKLMYGEARNGGDVEQMVVAPDVLELRLSSYPGERGVQHIVRMYFTEPEDLAEVMLTLHLTWKCPGPLMADEQSEQARLAARRLHEHSLNCR